MPYNPSSGQRPAPGGGLLQLLFRNPKLLMALGLALFAIIKYNTTTVEQENPFTGQVVTVQDMTPEQETALGLQSVPEMAQQFGGEVREPVSLWTVASVHGTVHPSPPARAQPLGSIGDLSRRSER